MRLRVLIPTVAALAALAVGGLWLARRPAAPEAAQAGQAQAGSALRLRWPAGVRTLYGLSWTSRTAALVAPAQGTSQESRLLAATDVRGTVALESLGTAPGGTLVAVSYASLDKFAFSLQGQDAIGDDRALLDAIVGQRVFVTLSPRAEVKEVAFGQATPPPVQTALRALVQQLQFTLPEGGEASWEAVEAAPPGALRVRYLRDGLTLLRNPAAFERLDAVPGALDGEQTLKGGAAIRLDADARLVSLQDAGEWRYQRRGQSKASVDVGFTFVLERRAEEACDAPALRAQLGGTKAQPLARAIDDPQRAARRDQRLAGKLTLDDLLSRFDHFEKGQRPGHDFIVRAGAFLRLHPEALARLAARFEDPALGFRGKGLLLDTLVAAGDANAQQVMRRLLQGEEARKDPRDLGMLVQRFSFVEEPEPASEQFLEEELQRARLARQVPAQQGAAAALGAMSDRLRHAGRPDLAGSAADLLARELRGSDNPNVQRALLAGLGNARRPEDVGTIAGFAGSDDPRLRLEAASALRWMETPEAHEALLQLASDRDANVAGTAVEALALHALGASDWSALRLLVQSGRIPAGADAPLVDLIRKQRASAGAEGELILRVLLARNASPENDLRQVIRELLEGTGG